MKAILLAVAALSMACGTAIAAEKEEKVSPLEQYQGTNNYNLKLCELTYKIALTRAENNALSAQQGLPPEKTDAEKYDFDGCIKKAKAEGKANLDKAMKTVKKTPAREALKTYHVAFIAAIDGIRAGNDEIRLNYTQRQNALQARLDDAWARFEIEN